MRPAIVPMTSQSIPLARRYVSDVAASVYIFGNIRLLYPACMGANGVALELLIDNNVVWRRRIRRRTTPRRRIKTRECCTIHKRLQLRKGTTLDVIVSPVNNDICDSVSVDISIWPASS